MRNLADTSVLALDGSVRGPLTEMLRFVNVTPVGQWTGQALARATATGTAELKLGLSLPLYDLSHVHREGQPRAGRQRRAHHARHAAARRRPRPHRLHAARA